MRFVSRKRLREIEAKYDLQWFIVLGQRSNGKSTAIKANFVEDAYNGKGKFIYIRRYQRDMKVYMINSYFKNMPGFDVAAITKGTWQGIECKANELRFYRDVTDDKGNMKRYYDSNPCGYVASLADSEHIKSLNYPGVIQGIFEEFATDQGYLDNECTMLFNLVSTVLRNNKGVIYLVANTISKVNPYFREFNLDKINKQKIDTVDIYHYDKTNIGCYLTAPIEEGKEADVMYFGSRARMINKGEWDQTQKRKREKEHEEYTTLYTMVFEYHDNLFLMEFQRSDDGHVWFISPKTTPVKPGTRLVTNKQIENDHNTFGFYALSENEAKIFKLLDQRKVAFSDGLTGKEFNDAYKQMKQEMLSY